MKRDLAEVITKAIEYKLAMLHVSMPGVVTAYYPDAQTADVQPLVSSIIELDEGTLAEEMPVIFNVPIDFPRGNGFISLFPLAPGDTGLLEFCDFSIDLWRASGLAGAPQDLRTHALGNAVFRPGLSPRTNPVLNAPANGLVFGLENGTQIVVDKTTGIVSIGAVGSIFDAAVLETKLISKFNAHNHPTGVGPSGVPIVPLIPGDVGATKVKAV
jgi:hypothetical protein